MGGMQGVERAELELQRARAERDVRVAYANLRELMTNATPPDSKRTEIDTQANLIEIFQWNNVNDPKASQHLKRYAEEALAEGHVELFEKAADWCQLFSVKEQSDLGPWRQCLYSLFYTIDFRSGNSLKLTNRLTKSKHYIRMLEMDMRLNINNENELTVILRKDLNLLNCAPDASVTLRGLYPLILELYNTKK